MIFNMNAGKPTAGWDQIFTLPRRLRLDGGGKLTQQPVQAVETLRQEQRRVSATRLPANEELVLPEINGDPMELQLEVQTDSPAVELRVLRSLNAEELTRIVFMRGRGASHGRDYGHGTAKVKPTQRESLLSIDTSGASLAPDVRPRGPETVSFPLGDDENLHLRVFVDRSVVEVFVDDRAVAAVRVYPSRQDSTGVSILSRGTDSQLIQLTAWRMNAIFTDGGRWGARGTLA